MAERQAGGKQISSSLSSRSAECLVCFVGLVVPTFSPVARCVVLWSDGALAASNRA